MAAAGRNKKGKISGGLGDKKRSVAAAAAAADGEVWQRRRSGGRRSVAAVMLEERVAKGSEWPANTTTNRRARAESSGHKKGNTASLEN
mmetsp:Transcript_21996/g.46392  ORF Transcript_21996/g.46392 Transcript_21996/m.46392 type:complete len:89 (-) Transcript_21996:51-317(-)